MTEPTALDVADDIDVDAAEAEAREAEALAAALEHAAVHADVPPKPGEIEQAEQLGRWARLRAERVRLRAARAAEARRVAACVALHDEIDQAEPTVGADVAALLEALDAAEAAVIAAAKTHDDRAVGWRGRAAALGVPETAAAPRPEDGLLVLAPSGSTDLVRSDSRVVGLFGADGENGLVRRFHLANAEVRAAIIAQTKRAGGIR